MWTKATCDEKIFWAARILPPSLHWALTSPQILSSHRILSAWCKAGVPNRATQQQVSSGQAIQVSSLPTAPRSLLRSPPELRLLSAQWWHWILPGTRAVTPESRRNILRLPQNKNKVHNERNQPESTRNQPRLPASSPWETRLHETGLWCQKGWVLLT